MVLPEEAEPLPLSVNQEKGRNGEPPDLLEPSTDSLQRKCHGGCGEWQIGSQAQSYESYLLPMDSRLLPFSLRLLLDARRKVTLRGGGTGERVCAILHPALQVSGQALSPLTPGPGTSGESSCPGQWWGWQVLVDWHHGCHLGENRGKETACVWLRQATSCCQGRCQKSFCHWGAILWGARQS